MRAIAARSCAKIAPVSAYGEPRSHSSSARRARVRVDVDRQHGAEDLLAHQLDVGRLGQHDRRLDEVALAVVGAAADEDLASGDSAREVDIALDAVKALPSITAPMKFVKSADVAHLDLGDLLAQRLAHRGHSEAGMYARDAAEHFWPWYSKAPRTSAVTSAATSAEGWAKTKSLPPVSPTMRG